MCVSHLTHLLKVKILTAFHAEGNRDPMIPPAAKNTSTHTNTYTDIAAGRFTQANSRFLKTQSGQGSSEHNKVEADNSGTTLGDLSDRYSVNYQQKLHHLGTTDAGMELKHSDVNISIVIRRCYMKCLI